MSGRDACRHGFLSVGGRRIEAGRWGPESSSAPTFVLLHEGLGCVELWRTFPARLAAATGWSVLAYSRLGYGRSDPRPLPWPIRFMHDEALDLLGPVLAAAGIERSVLVGHSDGGSIALVHAGGTPAAGVEGVVTLAAHVFCEPLTVETITAARDAYATGDLRLRLRRYHGDNVDVAFRGWCDTWLDPEFVHWDLREYLPQIRVPVLAIQGADDAYGTVDQLHAIARGARATTRLIPDCGHAPHLEQPDATLEALVGFAQSLVDR